MAHSTETLRRVPLGESGHIPLLGFGTFQLDEDRTPDLIRVALESGYAHIDTAEIYENEASVGRSLAMLGELGERAFITSKVWPGLEAWGYPEKGVVETLKAVDNSRSLLGRDCIDLYLIHMPLAVTRRLEVWEGLLEARSRGWIEHAGVSNYGMVHLREIEASGLEMPAANQCEIHPMHPLSEELRAYMVRYRIRPIAYSSLAPLGQWRLGSQWNSKDEAMHGRTHPVLEDCARRLGVTPAQVLLRWAIERGYPVLPKSNTPSRIEANAQLFEFELDSACLLALDGLDSDRCLAWSSGVDPLHTA